MLAVKMPLNRKKLQLDSLHFWLVFVSGSIVVIVVASAPQMPRFFELVSTSSSSSSSFLCPISSFIIQCAEEKIMSSKMKVASQHWTDWTDCDNVPNKTKDIFTLLRLKRFLYMIVGCSIPCRVVFAHSYSVPEQYCS